MKGLCLGACLALLSLSSSGQEIKLHMNAQELNGVARLVSDDAFVKSPLLEDSTDRNVSLIVFTGATLQGGDGWRIQYSIGVGVQKRLSPKLSVIGCLDYASFKYNATQTVHPPFQTDLSQIIAGAGALKLCVPWHVSPFIQMGLGVSYVKRGSLYYHDQNRYPPTPETDYGTGARSGITYLVNLMVGIELHPFEDFSIFLEGGFNGSWQKELYPSNTAGRCDIAIEI